MRKLLIFMLTGTLLLSVSFPAYAVNVSYDNRNAETDRVVIAQAEQPGTTYTGQGESHTQTDTRTQEQKDDDETKERIKELEELITDTINELHSVDMSSPQYPTSDLNPFPAHSGGLNTNFPAYQLPEYDLPDWALPEYTLPELPEWVLPELNMDTMFEDGEKAFDDVYVIESDDGILIIDQVSIPIAMLASYAMQLNKLNDNTFPGMSVSQQPIITIEDIQQPTPTPYDINAMLDKLKGWVDLNTPAIVPEFTIDTTIGTPALDDLYSTFPDSLIPSALPGTNINVAVPTDTAALYNILMRYLQELQSLGRNHVNVTRIAQYHVHEYAIRTLRISTPLNEYRWEVTGSGGSVNTQTETRLLKLLFRSAGTYQVRVFNNQQVIRNNKVSGEKRELWLLGNNDPLNGLVVYNNATSFEAYIGEDIGPSLEEIELIQNGFIANVTPQMVNKVHLIDTYGNIRSPSDSHTTQRQ